MRNEALLALTYNVAYVGYLFVNPESELTRWASLVVVPATLLILMQRRRTGRWSLKDFLASVGLRRGQLTAGLAWTIPLGLALSLGLQLLLSRNAAAFREIITSGRALYLAPLVLGLLLLTAGFTEEFFFRGILQTRLRELLRSKLLAILIVAILFGIYHLPYAYLNPRWPSHGDLGAAFAAAMSNGFLGGVVLGSVYVWARENLVAVVLLHSLIDLFPAMTQIRFG